MMHVHVEHCARAAHEVVSAYCSAIGDPPSPAWHDLTVTQRNGLIDGAQHAIDHGSPEASHKMWMATRLAEGWTWGPMKSFEQKTSPNLVPYEALPESQRRKDALFQLIVRSMIQALAP